MMNVRTTVAALATLAVLVGCEGQPDNGPPPLVKTQETVNAQIEKIKQDPNMTLQAKEAAIQGIQSSFDASKQVSGSRKQGG